MVSEDDVRRVQPLSHYSSPVRALMKPPIEIVRLFARPEDANDARTKVAQFLREPR